MAATGELERGYLALVWGAPSRPHGTIDAPIGRHPTSRTKMAVLPATKGREAVTHWRVVETFGRGEGADRLADRMHAGDRPHASGARASRPYRHPLIGDPLYGQGFKSKLRKLPRAVASASSRRLIAPSAARHSISPSSIRRAAHYSNLIVRSLPISPRSWQHSRNCERVAGFYLCDKAFYREDRREAISWEQLRPREAAGDGLSWPLEVCRVSARMAD